MEEAIVAKILEAFSPVHLRVLNESDFHHGHHDEHDDLAEGESHFRIEVVSEKFIGVSRLERERQVGGLFDAERARGLHALTMRLYTPTEWQRKTGR